MTGIDTRIAELMGWREVKQFSVDIAAAFAVVDRLREQDIYLSLDSHPEDGWVAVFDRCIMHSFGDRLWNCVGRGDGVTAAEAICRAALATVEANPDA